MALRVDQYKVVFLEQRAQGFDVWREPLVPLRVPQIYDLRADPFERGNESFRYADWQVQHLFAMYAAQAIVAEWLESLKEFPPRQKAASFSVDQIVEALMPHG
jgi:arylsulfatase